MSEYREDLKKHKSQLIQLGMKGMALFEILESVIPGLEGLHGLLETQHQEKVDRFCRALLNDTPHSDPETKRVLEKKVAVDFFELFRAFLQECDIEKAEYYARLTALIGGGHFDPDRRKHFVDALKSLTAKDMSLLRQFFLVKNFDLIAPEPLSSIGILTTPEVASQILQGELVSMSLTRLRSFQLFKEEGITNLGIEFIKATHQRDTLEPDILKGERAWQKGHVILIISKKPSSFRDPLIQALKARRIRTEVLGADQLSPVQGRFEEAKALVFFEPCSELTHSQQQSISRYSNSFHYHCVRVGPFTLERSMSMSYKASLDAKDAAEAAGFVASQYGFAIE